MATGRRVRYTLSKGKIPVGAGITSGDITLDLGEDPGWNTLEADEYIVLTLGDIEHVHVTAYTLGEQTCTIERGQENTGAATHPAGSSWAVAATPQDFLHAESDDLDQDHHEQYVHTDGRRGMTAELLGVDPTSGSGLATKDYVDRTAVVVSGRWDRISNDPVASGSLTTVTYDQTDHDQNPFGDWTMTPETGVLTINTTARYALVAGVGWATSGTGVRVARLVVNAGGGDEYIASDVRVAVPTRETALILSSGFVNLQEGDVVTLQVEHDVGSPLDLLGDLNDIPTFLAAMKVAG